LITYYKLKMWVHKDNYHLAKVEFYDKGGNLWKLRERCQITQINKYWFSKEMEMKDLKEQHSTIMKLENIEFDT